MFKIWIIIILARKKRLYSISISVFCYLVFLKNFYNNLFLNERRPKNEKITILVRKRENMASFEIKMEILI